MLATEFEMNSMKFFFFFLSLLTNRGGVVFTNATKLCTNWCFKAPDLLLVMG